MRAPVEILIVEDHTMVAEGLRLAADMRDDLHVRAVATTLAEAREMASQLRPDVIVLDTALPDGEGIDAIAELKASSGGRILVVSGFVSDHSLFRAVEAGVDGVITKGRTLDDILDAVTRVANGESVFSPEMLAKVMRRSGVGSSPDRSALTSRELDVLELLATGVSTEGIGESLHLSVNTVRNHISRILLKLGASTRLEAVAIGIRSHLVSPPRG